MQLKLRITAALSFVERRRHASVDVLSPHRVLAACGMRPNNGSALAACRAVAYILQL